MYILTACTPVTHKYITPIMLPTSMYILHQFALNGMYVRGIKCSCYKTHVLHQFSVGICVSQGSGMLTAGAVFRSFSETLFWNGDGKRPNPVTMVS